MPALGRHALHHEAAGAPRLAVAGAADLPSQAGSQMVARLEAASRVRQGQEAELWFNSEHLHLFDPENGQSLLGSDGDGDGRRAPDAPPAQLAQPDQQAPQPDA